MFCQFSEKVLDNGDEQKCVLPASTGFVTRGTHTRNKVAATNSIGQISHTYTHMHTTGTRIESVVVVNVSPSPLLVVPFTGLHKSPKHDHLFRLWATAFANQCQCRWNPAQLMHSYSPCRNSSPSTVWIQWRLASDSLATYGAIEMCFDWLIDWVDPANEHVLSADVLVARVNEWVSRV